MIALRKQIKKSVYKYFPGVKGAFPYYGVRVHFPQKSIVFDLACEQGIFERDNLSYILNLTKPDTVYFDIGANIGLMAIPVLQTHSSCTVVSFEPSPNTLPFLRKTAKESRFCQRWYVVGEAVSDSVGVMDFFIGSPGLGALDGLKDTGRTGAKTKVTVPITTIDTKWHAMGEPKVSFIKIDVEGAELGVLQGAIQCIRHERPYILTEWNDTNMKAYNCKADSLLGFCKDLDYQVVSLPCSIPVADKSMLQLQMIRGESFLLYPTLR